jgi:hypothetical protein
MKLNRETGLHVLLRKYDPIISTLDFFISKMRSMSEKFSKGSSYLSTQFCTTDTKQTVENNTCTTGTMRLTIA